MAFKAGFIMMAPDGDPTKHRASIKTSKLELTAVVFEFMNFDQAIEVCKELVTQEGVQSLFLCPSFHHEAVTRVVQAVGPGVAVAVARGDVPSGMIAGEILAREGWIPEGH
jgi:hypothetical protein